MNGDRSNNILKKVLITAVVPASFIFLAIFSLPNIMGDVVEKTLSVSEPEIEVQTIQTQDEQNTVTIIPDEPALKKKPAVDLNVDKVITAIPAEQAVIDEEERIEHAFDEVYQAPPDCENWDSNDHMVECINHRMKAKKEFTLEVLNNAE